MARTGTSLVSVRRHSGVFLVATQKGVTEQRKKYRMNARQCFSPRYVRMGCTSLTIAWTRRELCMTVSTIVQRIVRWIKL